MFVAMGPKCSSWLMLMLSGSLVFLFLESGQNLHTPNSTLYSAEQPIPNPSSVLRSCVILLQPIRHSPSTESANAIFNIREIKIQDLTIKR